MQKITLLTLLAVLGGCRETPSASDKSDQPSTNEPSGSGPISNGTDKGPQSQITPQGKDNERLGLGKRTLEEAQPSEFFVIGTNMSGPDCDKTLAGKTIYLASKSQFQFCDGSNWAVLDLKGPSGAIGATGTQGPKGDNGAQGVQGPTGPQGVQGLTGPQGTTGPQGPIGSQGPQGPQGPQGQAGIPSLISSSTENPGANCVLGGKKMVSGLDNGDSGGTALDGILQAGEIDTTTYICRSGLVATDRDGFVLGVPIPTGYDVRAGPGSNDSVIGLLLADDTLGLFHSHHGRYEYSYGLVQLDPPVQTLSYIRSQMACYFSNSSCSGTCYVGYSDSNTKPLKNALFSSGTQFFKATGNELDAGEITASSRYMYGTCESGGFVISHAYPVTSTYSLPAGFTVPIKAPIYFKMAQ